MKIEYCLPIGSDYLNRQSAAFLISATKNTAQKEVSKMIDIYVLMKEFVKSGQADKQ